MNNDLMQKLMVAKQIMDVHNNKPRTGKDMPISTAMLESFEAPQAKYNVPTEFLPEQQVQTPKPQGGPMSRERIMASNLPDEIKRLMLEHPIEQPKMMGSESILSDELVEAASRLMKTDARGNIKSSPQKTVTENRVSPSIDMNSLKELLRETIEEVLTEKGLVTESTQKTKEQISFRVGQHVFEGVVTKIKKIK